MHMHNGDATFAQMWSPGIFVLTLALVGVYWYLVGPFRARFADAKPATATMRFSFYCAALLFYVSLGSPIDYYSHGLSFSMHMLQMSFLYLLIPPLVYVATPEWLLRPLLMKPIVRKIVYPLTHPLLALFFFNVAFSFYHIPSIFAAAFDNMALHQAYHLLLAVLAFHMWFPVFNPVPEWNRISDLQKLGYIFANGVLLTPACALIIFASSILYPQFTLPVSWHPYMTALDDQQLGGTIMKIMQEAIYGTALAYIFFRWYRSERKKEAEEEARMDALVGRQPITDR